MKRLALFLALPLFGAEALAQLPSRPVVMPVFRRVFDFRLPFGFVPQPMQRNERQVLQEFLPAGETFDTWTRIITVRGLRGLGASASTTRDLATSLFDPKGCSKAGSLFIGPEQRVFGKLRRTVVVISCGRSPGNAFPGDKAGGGEQDFIYLFRDESNLYSVQYAVRGAGFDKPPIDPATADTVLTEQFGQVLLCATAEDPGCRQVMATAAANGFK